MNKNDWIRVEKGQNIKWIVREGCKNDISVRFWSFAKSGGGAKGRLDKRSKSYQYLLEPFPKSLPILASRQKGRVFQWNISPAAEGEGASGGHGDVSISGIPLVAYLSLSMAGKTLTQRYTETTFLCPERFLAACYFVFSAQPSRLERVGSLQCGNPPPRNHLLCSASDENCCHCVTLSSSPHYW